MCRLLNIISLSQIKRNITVHMWYVKFLQIHALITALIIKRQRKILNSLKKLFISYFVNPASSHPNAVVILIMLSNSCMLYINVPKLIQILIGTLNYLKHHHYTAVIFIISTLIQFILHSHI